MPLINVKLYEQFQKELMFCKQLNTFTVFALKCWGKAIKLI